MNNVISMFVGIGCFSSMFFNTSSFDYSTNSNITSCSENYNLANSNLTINSRISTQSSYTPLNSDTSTKYNSHILQEGDAMTTKTNKNLIAINNLREFKENWNGYGAKGFSSELCDFLEKIIKELDEENQPKVFPTGRESIQIEYEKDNGEYLEIEIFSPDRIELFQISENEDEIEKNISFDEIKGLVMAFNEI